MRLEINDVHRSFPAVEALRGVDLTVESGEFFAILGPSGAGKTTLLRVIAGIDRPSSGMIRLDGRDLTDVPVRARDTAMVFQTFALYPHLSTFENLAYPLREARLSKTEIARRVGEVAEMLRLTHTLQRKPSTLSGGEQQRCAIGRALVRRPRLLLLDEPLTNLDAKLRHDTRAELNRLHRDLGSTTIVYATPDQLEALSMGRRIGVLREGRIVQIATPRDLYAAPVDNFVATLVGDPQINLLSATLRKVDGRSTLELPFGAIDASPWAQSLDGFSPRSEFTVGVRPHDVSVVGNQQAAVLRFPVRVALTEPLGDVTILNVLAAGDTRLKMILAQERAERIRVDDQFDCTFTLHSLHLFARDTGTAICRDGAIATT
jgi:multiple sugar transport system ATP-binding protein